MIAACALFTCMGALAHGLGRYCPWQVIASARAFLVFCLVAVLSRAQGKRVFVFGPATLWVRSLAGSLSMVCTFYALTREHFPLSNTLTLTNMFPIWVALLSWPMLGERPSLLVFLAILCGFAGVWFIHRPQFAEGNRAVAAAASASVLTAFAMLGLHRLKGVEPQAIVVHFSGLATLFCLTTYFVFPHPEKTSVVSPLVIVLMFAGVGLTAAFGQILLTRAFAHGNPSRVAVIGLSQILFAVYPDVVFFEYRFTPASAVGMLLIALPTALVMLTRRPTPKTHLGSSGAQNPDGMNPLEAHPATADS
jgi:drug/metabolite transporter (DMT)-like permease